jgi:hypothetical protein
LLLESERRTQSVTMTKSVICVLAVLSVLSLAPNIALGDAKYRFVGEDVDQADIAELQNYRSENSQCRQCESTIATRCGQAKEPAGAVSIR